MKHKILIIGTVWVEPKSSAAGSRMLQLIEVFKAQNWEVTFVSTATKNDNAISLKELEINEVSIELNSSSFDNFISDLQPKIVLFDRFMTEEQFGWRVAENCPDALRILDTEDLHCLRKTREEALKKRLDFTNDLLLESDIAKREIASIYRCDISLIISSFEMQLLTEIFKIDSRLLFHLPFLLDAIDEKKRFQWKPFEDRRHFISIGNFLHAPNLDATRFLKKEIWTKIRERLPDAELHIYGAYPNQEVKQFHKPAEGFFVHGFIEDGFKVIENSRVLLAPLRFGAGIKGKLTDAMKCGTPSVTTKIGAEGMHKNFDWNGFVVDDEKGFVDKAIDLYSNKETWDQAQENGVKIINQLYNKEKLIPNFLDTIEVVYDKLQQHRNENFTGQLLMHHTLQSTKYLSKWIEAKSS